MTRIAVKSSEAKSHLVLSRQDILDFHFFLTGEKSLETLIIGAFGSTDAKPAWRSPVGELELSFPVIMIIDWAPVLTKVWAARTPPA